MADAISLHSAGPFLEPLPRLLVALPMQKMQKLAVCVRRQARRQRVDPFKQPSEIRPRRTSRFRGGLQLDQRRMQRLFLCSHVHTPYAIRLPIPSSDACKPPVTQNTRPMTIPRDGQPPRLFLGIEGGGSHTTALVVDSSGRRVTGADAGPGNIRLLDDTRLHGLLRGLRLRLPHPHAIAIGLAGARTDHDRLRIRKASDRVWPGVPCYATNDLETAIMAGTPARQPPAVPTPARVLVLSGTGSCCYGRSPEGRAARTGGWGHLLGDRGSAYDIALRALRDVIRHFDRTGSLSPLGFRLLPELQCNTPEDWLSWIQDADKTAIAAVALQVFACPRDPIARNVVRAAAADLARDACDCARLVSDKSGFVEFILAGGVLLHQRAYAARVRRLVRKSFPRANVRRLSRPSVWGAVELARLHFPHPDVASSTRPSRATRFSVPNAPDTPSLESLERSPTEQRNPRSTRLSRLPLRQAIRLMLNEDRRITPALLREVPRLERAIHWIVRALKHGGRLFYVGAGTSGRLGVLDASECPPTFRTSPDQIQGVIAGGQPALWQSIEGAEDDAQAGADALRFRGVTERDVVVGIAASGRTPFVWGALWQARKQGAKTVLLCFNPHLKAPRGNRPDLIIAPEVGPELLTGSTRLKSGTATKLILNLFTTLAMVRLGKVVSNLMVDLNPSNAKLRGRAIRIVRQLSGGSEADARAALERAGWIVKNALQRMVDRKDRPQ